MESLDGTGPVPGMSTGSRIHRPVNVRARGNQHYLVAPFALLSVVPALGGCRLNLDSPLLVSAAVFSDISGWDLSACAGDGFYTCAGLFADNEELILGGRTAEEVVFDTAMGLLSILDRTQVTIGRPPG